MHVKLASPHSPVSRHDNCVIPDGVYPVLQVCVAVAPYFVLPSTSRCVRPLPGLGNDSPQSTKLTGNSQTDIKLKCVESKEVLWIFKTHCSKVHVSDGIYNCDDSGAFLYCD